MIKKAKKIKETSYGKEIGVITHYFDKISVGVIALKSNLKVGDKILIKRKSSTFKQLVKTMQVNHKNVLSSLKGAEVGIKVLKSVHQGDKVYRVRV